jgi:hypothetical protein
MYSSTRAMARKYKDLHLNFWYLDVFYIKYNMLQCPLVPFKKGVTAILRI